MISNITMAFDRASARAIDTYGRMHVSATNISKASVNPYMGREIPNHAALGLDPNRVYKMYRDPEELAKAAPSFQRMPLLRKHVGVSADQPAMDTVVGSIGSNVEFKAPFLAADIAIWDSGAIAGVESGQIKELSCGYIYTADMVPGDIDGEKYDGRMTNIIANHVALVEKGRAGPQVVVADSSLDVQPAPKPSLTKEEISSMKMTKLGTALFVSLSAASQVLAADSALQSLVGDADRKTFDSVAVKTKLTAIDPALAPEKIALVVDSILEAFDTVEVPVSVATVTVDHDALKLAVDEAAKNIRESFKNTQIAIEDVRPVVGAVFGMDSAEEVYKFALGHLKIDHSGVEGTPALRAIFKASASNTPAPAPVNVTQDAADLTTWLPSITRFKHC